ncbi:MAG TPA: ABC transporter ATP-binding protein [Actinomycetota bacterium]|nr:ABC transporter ATP-binding protein [Actinomycetota bacterium]
MISTTTLVLDPSAPTGVPALEAVGITRRFGEHVALDDVSLRVMPGEIHALLGPNGAGKTTLVRVCLGLAAPDAGSVRLLGEERATLTSRRTRRLVGLVPSGDRTLYLRVSGLENLVFFARLHGMRKPEAIERARARLVDLGLADAADRPVSTYSHGMQKRLSVARALLADPPVLFVDEATHDLDPGAARNVQELVAAEAAAGAAVVWATQRLDEIRGFAGRVTVLGNGHVRFIGTVPQLMAVTPAQRFVVHLRSPDTADVLRTGNAALGSLGTLVSLGGEDDEHVGLALVAEGTLGEAVVALTQGGIQVLACREERSEIETAFLRLTTEEER